jgi:adenosylmethionine-8-amino-7-oxononanoate aminotransferase
MPAELKTDLLAELPYMLLDFRQMSAFVQEPLVMARADGVRYWDVHGKEYLDGISGIFVANLGHGNRRIIEAVKRQLDILCFAPPMHGTSVPALELVRLLRQITPGDLKTVKLLSGGSEAVEAALKFTLQYHRQTGNPRKYKFLSRYKGYHGATLGALGAAGNPLRRAPFEPLLANFLRVHPPHCFRCPYEKTWPECDAFCARTVEDTIRMEGPDTVAGVILEPITNTGGIITPPPSYLPHLREICDRHHVTLIFDEIITGFGRTGEIFAAQTFGVTPDILCVGKGMGSGYGPLAAILVSDRMAEAFWGDPEAGIEFAHGHTFAGNPLSCAAGVAAITQMLEEDIPARARRMGEYLAERLQALGRFGIVGEVRGKGMLRGVELTAPLGLRIGKRAMELGLILRYDADWFALGPPLIIGQDDLDRMLDVLERAIAGVLAG